MTYTFSSIYDEASRLKETNPVAVNKIPDRTLNVSRRKEDNDAVSDFLRRDNWTTHRSLYNSNCL